MTICMISLDIFGGARRMEHMDLHEALLSFSHSLQTNGREHFHHHSERSGDTALGESRLCKVWNVYTSFAGLSVGMQLRIAHVCFRDKTFCRMLGNVRSYAPMMLKLCTSPYIRCIIQLYEA